MLEDEGTRDSRLLYNLDLFRRIDPEIAKRHLERAEYRLLLRGEILLSPRSDHNVLYVVLSGVLSVHLGSPDSDLIATIGVGECAGEMSLFDQGDPSAYVVAAEDSRVLEMTSTMVWDMIDNCHGFAMNFLHLASSRMRASNRSISNSRKIQRHYENKANIDALTRLYNRQWIDQNFTRAFESCIADGLPLCLLMVDVDNFKQYNDDHGHLAGDVCLQAVAEAIRISIRPSDLLGRFGGEEFAILFTNTNLLTSEEIAERIRTKVEKTKIIDSKLQQIPSVTISIGVAENRPTSLYEDTLKFADEALYQAKNAGKNCVVKKDHCN